MRPVSVALLALALLCSSPAAGQEAKAARWWAHIERLASDEFAGRNTGSPGYDKAARYVAEQFRKEGLAPAGSRGFFQAMDLDVQEILFDRSHVAIAGQGGARDIRVGEELLLISYGGPQPATVEAPLVFIGYGLHLPEVGYDDFAGVDLKGKIAVSINGGPGDISGALKAHSRSNETWKTLEAAGALGLITIALPKDIEIPWPRLILLYQQAGMYPADPTLRDTRGPQFRAAMNPEFAETLFANSGHTFAEVMALGNDSKAIKGFPLNASLKASVTTRLSRVKSANVVGRLEGSDSRLKAQHVVLTAHLDHLGIGEPINGQSIYRGAMDNASGVASLIEIAHQLRVSGARPKRSILFVALTGEEKGLLGSRYFAERPTVPRDSLAANLNVDMALPLWPLEIVMLHGMDESTLTSQARGAAEAMGLEVMGDPFPDRNAFVRSDQYSFVRKGVPALAFRFGYRLDSQDPEIEKEWRRLRYHAPADDLTQPVDRAAADKFNNYLTAVTLRVADAPARPQWLPESFFRRFAPGAGAADAKPD